MTAIHPNGCVHELFEAQAAGTPDAIAVVCGDTQATYRELDDAANAVARRLCELGIGPDVIVAICMERSIDMVAGLLGILKAGGAYLPLDPAYPRERLISMLEDSNAGMVLTEAGFREKIFAGRPRVHYFDSRAAWLKPAPPARHASHGLRPAGSHLAYVIYTSGSTGRPKGVAMPHAPLVNLLDWHLANLPGARRTLQFASLSFDVSFQEIFSTLAAGGTLVLISEEMRRDPVRLWDLVVREKIERLFLPCVALQQLADAAGRSRAPDLRDIVTAGEQLRITPAISSLFENNSACALHNHYGPTESHVVTAFSLRGPPRDWPALPPIGKPVGNAGIHILDDKLDPVAPGQPGGIYISGPCLARGYLNRPDITAQKFLLHGGARLYKSGDTGRLLPGGDIEFLGRSDDQVKIRGHRVEPGEIEAEMLRHPSVSRCVVTAVQEADTGRRLVAYVVPRPDGAEMSSDGLCDFLRMKLPPYMIPSAFALLDALPLTQTGKIDRRALPQPGSAGFCVMQRRTQTATSLPPTSATEAELIEIWEEILDLRPIGPRENFFDLGGHSMLAMQVMREVERKFGKRLPPMTIFRAPTVEEFATTLDDETPGGDDSSLEKIRVEGSGTPFFCIPGLLDLARHLGPDQPCYGLNMPELGNDPESWPAVAEIAAGCIRTMRSVQPEGPYCVGGYSFGGVIAFEIARQLEAAGETISLLALLEPDPPRPFRTTGFAFNLSRFIFHERKIANFGFRKRLRYLSDRLRKRRSRLSSQPADAGNPDAELAAYMSRTEAIHARYHAAGFGGKAILFLAQDTLWRVRPEKDPRLHWNDFAAGGLEIHEIPGDHTSVIREPSVRSVAQHLGVHLKKNRRMNIDEPDVAAIAR